jgi:hypothetical protein
MSRERGDPEVIANCELNLGDAARVRNDLPLAREYFESVDGLPRKRTTSDWMKWRYSQHLFAGLARPGWRWKSRPRRTSSVIGASSLRPEPARKSTWCAAGA